MISSLLSSKGFIVTNKAIAKGIGLYESVILAELCSEYEFHLNNGSLTEDGYFYCTANTLESETTLSVKEQSKPISKLVKIGFIKSKLKGIPAKRHFKIDDECSKEILQFIQKGKTKFVQKGETVIAQKAKQALPKEPTNKNIDNNINKNKSIMSSSKNSTPDPDGIVDNDLHILDAIPDATKTTNEAAAEKPKKPKKVTSETDDEKEKIDKLIDFLNKKLGSDYRKETAPTRTKILKLLNYGYDGKDFATVITDRIKEWAKDEKMKKYLTPATLFAVENFEKYLNLAKQNIPKSLPENKEILTASNEYKLYEKIKTRLSLRECTDEQIMILLKYEPYNQEISKQIEIRKERKTWTL